MTENFGHPYEPHTSKWDWVWVVLFFIGLIALALSISSGG